MVRLVSLCVVLGFAFAAAPAPARAGYFWGCSDTVYWCTRDAIYAQFKLIARLEADPDVDEAVKGPLITAARAEIHRLRELSAPAAACVGDDRYAAARRAGDVLLRAQTALSPLSGSGLKASGSEADMVSSHGSFVWYELTTTDAEAAKTFYADVVGWGSRDASMPDAAYSVVHRRRGSGRGNDELSGRGANNGRAAALDGLCRRR